VSPLDRPVPPAGEEIHLPGQSIQPLLLAFFITVALVGVTFAWILTVAGGIGALAVIVRWIRDARRELEELPAHHEQH
jgi:Flp pilus assembly protein TadB